MLDGWEAEMYPRDFFDTYWRPEILDEVFVAMPFHDEFKPVWDRAIQPAIDEDVAEPVQARRVDATILSGSVITDILDGIAHARLILADISVAREGKWRGQRNGNVMYEVGLAHAVRQNKEILLVRSDNDPINFDVAHINIHKYDRDNLDDTRHDIFRLTSDCLKQIEQHKSLMVTRAVDQLDADAMTYLSELAVKGPFTGPSPKTMGEELLAIARRLAIAQLQRLGIIRCISTATDQTPIFDLTPFGKSVAQRLGLSVSAD
jgi:hypothetical protein